MSATYLDKAIARFETFLGQPTESGCIEWQGCKGGNKLGTNHGIFSFRGKPVKAHRFSWEFVEKKNIPEGMCVLHTCDNPPCCNPSHHFLGTRVDNIKDCVNKGRNSKGAAHSKATAKNRVRGERHPSHRLTDAEVQEIRELKKLPFSVRPTHREIGLRFNIDPSYVSRLIHKKKR
ncbi:MAG: endonuclease family protein [Sphingomonadales bacterium]|nr:endonuclease family protein [Sphingomonadales bacterium]